MNTTNEQIKNDIATLMAGWNTIETAAKTQFPNASKEELYSICKGAMDHAMKGGK